MQENGIIVDDKITGNAAREWESSLLSRFFSLQRKMHEKQRHRWRWMFLKKDAQYKSKRRARKLLKHH